MQTVITTPLTAAQLETMLAQEPSSHARMALLRLHAEARIREAGRAARKVQQRRKTWGEISKIFAPLAIICVARFALAIFAGI